MTAERKTKKKTTVIDYFYVMVKKFQTIFGHPVAEKPKPMTLERATKRAIWTAEEAVVEFLHQTSDNEEQFLQAMAEFQEGLEKAVKKSLGMAYTKNDVERLIGQGDALTDSQYFVSGSFVETGLQPTPLFDIVHQANMAKLGKDGLPIRRESDGKIMKPEGWMPPEPQIEAEILRQIEEAK